MMTGQLRSQVMVSQLIKLLKLANNKFQEIYTIKLLKNKKKW